MAITKSLRVYNIIEARLKYAAGPLSRAQICQLPDLSAEPAYRIADCLKSMHKKGMLRKVPTSVPGTRDRVGYEWIGSTTAIKNPPKVVPVTALEDIKVVVNSTHSITVITKSIKVTLDVAC